MPGPERADTGQQFLHHEHSPSMEQVFSDIPRVQELLTQKLATLGQAGVEVALKQMLPYGTQLHLSGSGLGGLVNIYFSKKKGLSFVDCTQNMVTERGIAVLKGADPSEVMQLTPGPNKTEGELSVWVGTDESGKGDLFGPLVIAGFLMTRGIEGEVMDMGVTDSKKLVPSAIRRIAQCLRKRFPDNIEVVAPTMARYNELYARFRNLNKLLAWGHARVIENLSRRWEEGEGTSVDGAVADKFGDKSYIRRALSSMQELNLIQRPGGESNTAVAAASIIARDTFERRMATMGKRVGMRLPFGAGSRVLAAARTFVRHHGRDKLGEVAKLHFKTCKEV